MATISNTLQDKLKTGLKRGLTATIGSFNPVLGSAISLYKPPRPAAPGVKTTSVAPSSGVRGSSATASMLSGGRLTQQPAPTPSANMTRDLPALQPQAAQSFALPTANAMTTSAPQSPVAEKRGLFPDVVGGLVKTGQTDPAQKALIELIAKTALESKGIGADARATAEKYGNEINRVGQLGAGAVAGDLSTGTNVVGSGNAAIASQSASQRMSALAQGLESELSGIGKQLTAQDLATSGLDLSRAGNLAQQTLQQAGLGTAAGLIAPQVTGFGQTAFNPLTGTFGGGSGNLDPQTVASDLARKVATGQMTYEQAVSSLGYAGGAGQQFLNSALQQIAPGFNAPLSTAQVGGQANVFGNLPALQSAEVQAEGIKNKITTYLTSNPQLNPSTLAVGNTLKYWIEGKQLTDPKYQTLFNYLNEYTNTLAPILGVGGDPTNLKTQIAQSFVNAAASGESISAVLEDLQTLSRGKLEDMRSGALGGGVVSSSFTSSGNTGTGSGGTYDW